MMQAVIYFVAAIVFMALWIYLGADSGGNDTVFDMALFFMLMGKIESTMSR